MIKASSPRLMIVGGGEWQVPLVKKAKACEAFVLTSNLYADSPCFPYSDACEIADVLDFDANLKIAKKHSPDAILTDQSDIAVPTVAKLCDALQLPGIGQETSENFTNKYKMRKASASLGHPSPFFQKCENASHLKELLSRHKRLVVKPVDSQSSRGVRSVESVEAADFAFTDAMMNSHSKQVIVEEFIKGTEFTVEGLKTPQQHHCLAVSIKNHYDHSPMVANRLMYPSDADDYAFDDLLEQHNELIHSLSLPFGLTHAEYLLRDGKYYLVEVAARGGGTKISSHIAPLVSGVSTYDYLIKMSLGEHVEEIRPVKRHKAAVLEFFELNAGIVRTLSGVEKATRIHGILDVHLNFKVGDRLESSRDDRSRHMHIISSGDTAKEAESVGRKAFEELNIVLA